MYLKSQVLRGDLIDSEDGSMAGHNLVHKAYNAFHEKVRPLGVRVGRGERGVGDARACVTVPGTWYREGYK